MRRISIAGFLIFIGGYIGGMFPVPANILQTGLGSFGTSIWVMAFLEQMHTTTPHLAVVSFRRVGPVEYLSDLQGCVHISAAADALKFVRIKTSLSTWYYSRSESEAEIVTTEEAFKLPTYGLRRLPDLPFPRSGLMGVISSQSFRKGGFTPAHVDLLPDSFCVTRWVLNDQEQARPYLSIQKVQEFVGKDGSYRRVVLVKKEAPKLPDVYWELETFE